jgi:hypothetical protein
MTSDSNLFRNARRKSELTDPVPLYEAKMVHQFDHRWATYIGDTDDSRDMTDEEKHQLMPEHVPKEVKNLLQMRKYATVRLGVNIPVTETFYVRDEVTGAVIQGSTEPSRVVHNLLLESLLEAGTHGKFSDWEVCDLDGWVEGNEFWVESKKVVNTKGTSTSSSSGSSSPSP